MKAIFLCKNADVCHRVYDEGVVSKLRGMTELDEAIYTKEDILSSADKFSEAEFVFSTWGMPIFSEEEI